MSGNSTVLTVKFAEPVLQYAVISLWNTPSVSVNTEQKNVNMTAANLDTHTTQYLQPLWLLAM